MKSTAATAPQASNKAIRSLWIGKSLTPIERLTICSFLANGHEFHLYAYDDIDGVPEGTTLCDAASIIPRNEVFRNPASESGTDRVQPWGAGSFPGFSNIFRYTMLLIKGGWWVDMDVVCLRPFDHDDDLVIATSREWKWGIRACTNVLKAPRDSPFIRDCLEQTKARYEREGVRHGLAPQTLQSVVAERGMESHQVDYRAFNPVNWRYVKYLLRPQESFLHPRRIKRALGITLPLNYPSKRGYALHLWNEVWNQSGFDRTESYHPKSLFEKLKRRYFDSSESANKAAKLG